MRGVPRGHGRTVLETAGGKSRAASLALLKQQQVLSVIFDMACVLSLSLIKPDFYDSSVQINRNQRAVNVTIENILKKNNWK